MRFEGKVVIVTGAASGIGLATAKRFAKKGGRVVIADLKADKAQLAAEECKNAGAPDAIGVECDVSNEPQVEATVNAALTHFGHLHIIVNNAGLMIFKPLEEQTTADW